MLKIITTSDGSHSLLNTALDETYHSQHGAVQESMHVFIKNGLDFWVERNPGKPVNIFEVGFGTGLNALLAASAELRIDYTSIEAFPLDESIYTNLNYTPKDLLQKLHHAAWNEFVQIDENFRLKKLFGDLRDTPLQESYDIIFFDAFSPAKEPLLWELPVIEKVCSSLTAGGVFVTYCAKGQLKRDLKSLGMEVETLDGSPGKKEMVRGTKR